jgi:cyclophilin family peptidyl-prolyl cis-trans isomerase
MPTAAMLAAGEAVHYNLEFAIPHIGAAGPAHRILPAKERHAMNIHRISAPFGLLLLSIAVVAGCTEGRGVKADRPIQSAQADKPAGEPAPPAADAYQVKFETSCGDFVLEVVPKWAPRGAQRFRELVELGYYNDCRFFRVLPGFMAQFGINGDPEVQKKWQNNEFPDDPVVESNKRGMVSFATRGPDTRTTQIFINFGNNNRLDDMGFAPFAKVVSGMEAVDKINAQYREMPIQPLIQSEGNAYLNKEFPKLDYVKKATIVKPAGAEKKAAEKKAEEKK